MYPACSAHAPCCIVVCDLSALQYFSTLSNKRHYFWGKKKKKKKNVCSDFLCNFCLKHVSFWRELSKVWSEVIIGTSIHVTYTLFLSDINEIWIFWTNVGKILKYQTFKKIRPVWTELFHTDGRTDEQTETSKLTDMSRNFANATEKPIS